MNGLELFLREHAIVHSAELVKGESRSTEDTVLRDLDETQMRARPHGLNSLAWIFWHIARYEDVAVNAVVAARPQVFDEGGWAVRLGIDRRDMGTGMNAEEVALLSEQIAVPALRAYRLAVGGRTRDVAEALPEDDWERIVGAEGVGRASAQGAFGPYPEAAWVERRLWPGKSHAWFLHWLGVGHNLMHIGQARWVRKLILGKGMV
ncbi:MAG TPA: DinB family protein [bacterium]|jgi:hypothetical protein|nr:DinB family protein [bacterium]